MRHSIIIIFLGIVLNKSLYIPWFFWCLWDNANCLPFLCTLKYATRIRHLIRKINAPLLFYGNLYENMYLWRDWPGLMHTKRLHFLHRLPSKTIEIETICFTVRYKSTPIQIRWHCLATNYMRNSSFSLIPTLADDFWTFTILQMWAVTFLQLPLNLLIRLFLTIDATSIFIEYYSM